jgi:hypothetical protein
LTLREGFQNIQSTLPIDKIYGILGLIEDEEGQTPAAQLIDVNYQKKIGEVFWDTIFECHREVLSEQHEHMLATIDSVLESSARELRFSSYSDFRVLETYCKDARTSKLHASCATVSLRVYEETLTFMHVLGWLGNWVKTMQWEWKMNSEQRRTKLQSAAYVGFRFVILSTEEQQAMFIDLIRRNV